MSTSSVDGAIQVSARPREHLAGLARSGFRLFMSVVPSLLGSGFWGALKGFCLFGVFGLVMAGAFVLVPRLSGAPPTPTWLEVLGLVLTPLSLALAGGYVLMLHGVSSRLAEEVQRHRLMGFAYAILKPATVQVARRLRGTGPLDRRELKRALEQSIAERMGDLPDASSGPSSRRGWLERFLMMQSRRALGAIALRSVLSTPDVPTAVRELESLALDRLEGALVETLEDLFSVQMMLAFGAGVLVAAMPTLLLLLRGG